MKNMVRLLTICWAASWVCRILGQEIQRCFEEDIQYLGRTFDVKKGVSSVFACQVLCADHEFCSYFSYKVAKRRCELKWGNEKPESVVEIGIVSGSKSCVQQPIDACFQQGYVYRGKSLAALEKVPSAQECQAECEKHPSCAYFSYISDVNYWGRWKRKCYLKSWESSHIPQTRAHGAVSGPKICLTLNSSTTYHPQQKLVSSTNRKCSPATSETISEVNDVTMTECEATCKGNYECLIFTYDPAMSKCFLYKKCTATDGFGVVTYRNHKPPRRGYSSWNYCYKFCTENLVRAQADLLEKRGLIDAGYDFFHLDGACTFSNHVNRTTGEPCSDEELGCDVARDEQRRLKWPDACLPSGRQSYMNYLKNKKLTVGWYTAGHTGTCNGQFIRTPETFADDVERDVQTYKEWGVDVLKIDSCGPISPNQTGYETEDLVIKHWADMIAKHHPDMLVENGKYGCHFIEARQNTNPPNGVVRNHTYSWEEYCPYVGDTHRAFIDIRPWAGRIFLAAEAISRALPVASPERGWPFGDALELCNYDFDTNELVPNRVGWDGVGLTKELEMAHWGMWVIMSQTLLLSTDISKCSADVIAMITDRRYLDINEAYSGDAGSREVTTMDGDRNVTVYHKGIDTVDERIDAYLFVDESAVYNTTTFQLLPDESIPENAFNTSQLIDMYCPIGSAAEEFWNTGKVMFRSVFFRCISTK